MCGMNCGGLCCFGVRNECMKVWRWMNLELELIVSWFAVRYPSFGWSHRRKVIERGFNSDGGD
jgi:hypothetical protein